MQVRTRHLLQREKRRLCWISGKLSKSTVRVCVCVHVCVRRRVGADVRCVCVCVCVVGWARTCMVLDLGFRPDIATGVLYSQEEEEESLPF